MLMLKVPPKLVFNKLACELFATSKQLLTNRTANKGLFLYRFISLILILMSYDEYENELHLNPLNLKQIAK